MINEDQQTHNFKGFFMKTLSIYMDRTLEMIPITLAFIWLKYCENEYYVPALALSFTFNLFVFGFINGLLEAIIIRCSYFYSEQNYDKFSISFYRFIVFDIVLSVIGIFVIFYIQPLLILIGVEEKLGSETATLLQKLLVSKILGKFIIMLKGVLISQKLFYRLNYISIIGLFAFLAAELIFMVILDMELNGYVIAFTIRFIAETIYTIYTVIRYIPGPYLKIPKLREIWQDFFKELLFVLNISFANYFDFIAYEIHTVYVASLKDNASMVAWSLSLDIQRYCFYILVAVKEVFIVQVNSKLAEKSISVYKQVKRQLMKYSFWMTIGMGVIVAGTAPFYTRLYSQDEKVLKPLLFLMFIYFPIAVVDITFLLYTSLLRIINEEKLQFIISLALLPLGNIVLGYLFCFTLNWKLYGTRMGYGIITLIYALALKYAFNKKEPGYIEKLMNEKAESENELMGDNELNS